MSAHQFCIYMYCAYLLRCFKFWRWALSVKWADARYSTA
ncbi:unnamed protein product [Ixodes persulcatus]